MRKLISRIEMISVFAASLIGLTCGAIAIASETFIPHSFSFAPYFLSALGINIVMTAIEVHIM